jgi:NTE family protein
VIDLWDAAGPHPRTLSDVLWRQKQIQYATRTARHIESVTAKINLRYALKLLKRAKVPEVGDVLPAATDLGTDSRLDFVHIIYHPEGDQIPNSDAEFSRASIEDRRAAGYRDMRRAIEAEPWVRRERPPHLSALVHRVTPQGVVTLPEQTFAKSSSQLAAA